jgi:peptidyl-prolyl cis-trans isomerase D
MALIGKIRQRTGLLLGFIGLALVMFLLMDALSQNSMFAGAGNQTVGKINGKEIPIQEFNQSVLDYQNQIRILNPQLEIDAQTQAAIVQETWNDYLFKATAGRNFSKLGLDITDQELTEQFTGRFPHALVRQLFGNPQTGQFDPMQVQEVISTMDQIDPSGKLREQILAIEKMVEQDRIRSKYHSLFNKAFYMPSFVVEHAVNQNAQTASISVVSVPLTAVEDKDVSVSTKEIEQYIKENSWKYQREASRSIEFVVFDLIPSAEDSARSLAKIEELSQALQEAGSNDSAFIRRNAIRGYDETYFSLEELASRTKGADLAVGTAGTIIGPYIEQGGYVITKVQGRRNIADSVRAAHILLQGMSPQDAQAKADSLITAIRSGQTSFAQAAFDNSTDEGSKQQGGDLGVFGKGQMVKPFNDMVFYNMNPGEIRTVESQFGFHIILLISQFGLKPGVRFADIVVPIRAGSDTERELFRKAREFENEFNTPAKFAKAKEKGYEVFKAENLTTDQVIIPEIGVARKVVQWAFREKSAGVISYFDENDKFIVAHLTKVLPKGTAAATEVKDEVERILLQEKKGKILADKVNAAAKSAATMQELAGKVNGTLVEDIQSSFSSDYVNGVGIEPKVVATAFGLKPGKRSNAIAGSMGVYVVELIDISAPDMSQYPREFFAMQFRQSVVSRLSYQNIIQALKDKSKVEDKRYEFY